MADEIGTMGPADIAALMKNDKSGMGAMGAWFLLVLFLFAGMNGNGGFFGNRGPAGPMPATEASLQRGFDQNTLQNMTNGIAQQVNNGFANAAVARCNAQQNLLQQMFTQQMSAMQTANANQAQTNQGFNAMALGLQQMGSQSQQGISDLKFTIAQENCADRQALNNGLNNLMAQNVANTTQLTQTMQNGFQGIQDKLCALQIENLKEENEKLRQQVNLASLSASQLMQTQQIIQNNTAQTTQLIQRIAPAPVPAYVVSNPNSTPSTTAA